MVLRHRETGLLASASERRSQEENRRAALFRLRVVLALESSQTGQRGGLAHSGRHGCGAVESRSSPRTTTSPPCSPKRSTSSKPATATRKTPPRP